MAYTLRVSVLEHCQLRCNYCLPPENLPVMKNWLNLLQYEKVVAALAVLKLHKIRFTGGEPLLRPDLSQIIKLFAKFFPEAKLALTTNGLRFNALQDALKEALHSITFHLDTLKQDKYGLLMGKGEVKTVLLAIEQAINLGLQVKINVVVQKDSNDDELYDFLCLSKKISAQVRFIEIMNTGSAKNYVKKAFISGKEIIDKITAFTPVDSLGRPEPSAPAELFFCKDLGISFGLIASDTQPFCAHCDRLRLSADGRLYTCLYEPHGQALLPFSDDKLVEQIKKIVAKKTSFHPLLNKECKDFSMSKLGG